jgi:general secretion pathway protein F
MAIFQYKGLNAAGTEVSGIIDSDNAKSARSKLRKQGVFPTAVDAQEKGATKGTGLNLEIDFAQYFERVTVKDVCALTGQLSTLIGANIPIVEALTALIDQVEKPKLERILRDIREKVNQGATLAEAMGDHSDVFSPLYINMVGAGEQSGSLVTVLQRLTDYTEAQVALRGKIVTALTYPALMGGVSGLIIIGLFVGVIPRIKRVFETMDTTLPALTRAVMAFSDFLIGQWYIPLAIAIAMVVAFRRWVGKPEGQTQWHGILLKMPVIGNVNRKVAVSRFCRTMSTLLDSGVPILTAVSIVKTVVGNDIIAMAIEKAGRNIAEGQSIAEPLKASGQFPPLVTHMINIGEKTGELEPMLSKVADAYDQEVERTLEGLTSILEPVMIVVMGGIVAIVALSILLPMLNMSAIAK